MAYDFVSASSQSISYGDVTFLDGLTEISGHAWVNVDSLTADHYIMSKFPSGGSDGFLFLQDDVGGGSGRTDTFTIGVYVSSVLVALFGATNAAVIGSNISVGFSWKINDANGLRLYINGTEDANSPVSTTTQTGSFANTATPLYVGRASFGSYMDGQIGTCSLYSGILTADDFSSLSKGYHPSFIKTGTLLFAPSLIRSAYDPVSKTSPTISGATVTEHHKLILLGKPKLVYSVPTGETIVTLFDSAIAQDSVLALLSYSRSLGSSTTVYDAVTIATVTAEILRILADTANLRDEAKIAIQATRGLQSSSAVSDVIAREALYSRLVQSALDVNDSLSILIATIFSALLRDEIAVQDSVSIETLRQIAKVLTDSVAMVDSVVRSTDLYRLLSENVETFDSILASIITSFAERVLSDRVAVSDEIVRQLLRSEQVQFIVMELLRRDIDMDIKARNIVMKLLERSIDDELN